MKKNLSLQKIKQFIKPKNILIFAIFAVLVIHALPAGYNADFIAINGDFQNYNVIRHLLAGEAPYHDFVVYLGSGHLLIGTILSFIFGIGKASFIASKIAFSFAAFGALALFAYLIFYAVFYKKSQLLPLVLTLGLLLLVHLNFDFFENFLAISPDFYKGLSKSLSTGNSARFLRQLAPAVYILFVFLLHSLSKKFPKIEKYPNLKRGLIFGIPAGFSILFSNDAGLSTFFCASMLFFFVSIFQKTDFKNLVKRCAFYGLFTILSFVLFGEIFTLGHLGSYITSTISTGDYQSWYYLSSDTYYVFLFDSNIYMLLQLIACLIYFIVIKKEKGSSFSIVRCGIPLLLNASGSLSANLYQLVSGHSNREVALSIFYCTIIGEVAAFLLVALRKICNRSLLIKVKTYSFLSIAIFLVIFVVSSVLSSMIMSVAGEKGAYVENVGPLSSLANSILSTDDFLSPDDSIFSTYASGLELHRGTLQPSGYDYIIHVLGDKARNNYIESFKEANPDYVTTIRPTYSNWEYWIRNANFFFYREIYRDYEPVYANDYQVFWKKKTSNSSSGYNISKVNIEIGQQNDHQATLKVVAPGIKYGVADINLNYEVQKDKSKKSLFTHKTLLKVENAIRSSDADCNTFYTLASKPGEFPQIGVPIIDGVGEIVITSQPDLNTLITNLSATTNAVYTGGIFSSFIPTTVEYDQKNKTLHLSAIIDADEKVALERAQTINISGNSHKFTVSYSEESKSDKDDEKKDNKDDDDKNAKKNDEDGDRETAYVTINKVTEDEAKEYLNLRYYKVLRLEY